MLKFNSVTWTACDDLSIIQKHWCRASLKKNDITQTRQTLKLHFLYFLTLLLASTHTTQPPSVLHHICGTCMVTFFFQMTFVSQSINQLINQSTFIHKIAKPQSLLFQRTFTIKWPVHTFFKEAHLTARIASWPPSGSFLKHQTSSKKMVAQDGR